MKHPLMFERLATAWIALPRVVEEGIKAGFASREPRAGWVSLKGLSPISDLTPAEAYAQPGFASAYNKEIAKYRRRAAFSAFIARISKSELEAQLQTHAALAAALEAAANRPDAN